MTLAKAFYIDFATALNLQYGNILLATSTKSQLQALRNIDVPFFTNNTDLVKACLSDSKCDRLQDIIGDLGKTISLSHPTFLANRMLQMSTMYQKSFLSTPST